MMRPRPKSIGQLQRDLFELSKPFVQAKCDILSTSLPTYYLYPDGRMVTIYSAEVQAELARIDQVWTEARNQFCTGNGLTLV